MRLSGSNSQYRTIGCLWMWLQESRLVKIAAVAVEIQISQFEGSLWQHSNSNALRFDYLKFDINGNEINFKLFSFCSTDIPLFSKIFFGLGNENNPGRKISPEAGPSQMKNDNHFVPYGTGQGRFFSSRADFGSIFFFNFSPTTTC